MTGTIMNKIYGLLGYEKETEDAEDFDRDMIYDYDNDNEDEDEQTDKRLFGMRKNKVTNISQSQQIKMIIAKPTNFEQTEEICECLKERKSIIVNLEYVNKDVARRIVDFMSGSVQALDGHIEKVSNSIFLFAPFNYDISNETTREEMKNKLSVSWLKNG